jgi:hypothetical protein
MRVFPAAVPQWRGAFLCTPFDHPCRVVEIKYDCFGERVLIECDRRLIS